MSPEGMGRKPTMRTTLSISVLLAASLILGGVSAAVWADSAPSREYQLKAAFLYNFMVFINNDRLDRESGDKETPDPNKPIVIGIVGVDPFEKAFAPLKDRRIRNRRVVVKRFKGFDDFADPNGAVPRQHPQLDAIEICHVLFVCASERPHVRGILSPIRKIGILTVADMPGFLEAGGMINFVIEDKKVRFEVNTAAAERARLQIRSRLLRLAKRVVRYDPSKGHDDEENESVK